MHFPKAEDSQHNP
jgi:hypothetical protein